MAALNDRQLEAVAATEGKVRVVAGAGSGKTMVLAHRYAFLVNEVGVAPGNILCMTFTNKAAAEMRRRIGRLVERGSVNDFICTIHGFCAKFLRSEIFRIGYPKNFIILDEEDGKALARQAMQEYGIDRRKTTAERFLGDVGKFKGADAEGYILHYLLPGSGQTAPDAMVRYLKLQLKQYALDYDDLLYFTLYILSRFPEAREKWVRKLNYIMVDEAQDCSSDDWQLLYALSEGHGNLFVVGDPDQAIYEWRGASPGMFVNFKADTTIILDRNYRSTPQILDAANAIIANNRNRIPKDLWSDSDAGDLPVHNHCGSQREECDEIASLIADCVAKGKNRYSDFAVLYRSSFLSAELEKSMLREKIPYTVWGGVKFLQRKEIKDALSYLRVINSGDDMSFERIINVPSRKFGRVTLQKLRDIAEEKGGSLYDALTANIDAKPFNTPAVRRFVALVEEARLRREVVPVSEITDFILTATGYTDMLRRDEEEERLENLAELLNQMKEYENTHESEDVTSLDMYLQDMALYSREEEENDKETVRLMTIHQSKGLEFPVVFVLGLTEGTFPSHRTIRERRQQGEEEERRLMYVAVTRAMRRLYLSESEGFMNESGSLKFPSRFLYEIPDDKIVRNGAAAQTMFENTRMVVDSLNRDVYGLPGPLFQPGDHVVHRIFGKGVVLSHDAEADSYAVQFAACTRNLLPGVLSKES